MKSKLERCYELLSGPCPALSIRTVLAILSDVLEEMEAKERKE